ncbi:MAG: cell envelope integrity protein TolA [Pseudomonadota bacterium]
MRAFFDNLLAGFGTILLHAAIVALLVVGVRFEQPPQEQVATTIKAVVVSDAAFRELSLPDPVVEAPPVDPPAPDPELLQRQQETEERLAREREEAARAKQAEAERQRQQQEESDRKAREAAEREAQAALAAKEAAEQQAREAAEQAAREEAERKAREEAERRAREEAERKAREEAERKAREEAARKRREAEERARQEAFEAQLQAEIEAEEQRQGAIRDGLLAQYNEDIRRHVRRNWNTPPGVPNGITCVVTVRQSRSGVVLSWQVASCPGSDALRRSIEQAVEKSSPLPPPPDPSLFEPNLTLRLKTGEDD